MYRNLFLAVVLGLLFGTIKFYFFTERAESSIGPAVIPKSEVGVQESFGSSSLLVEKSSSQDLQSITRPLTHSNSREVVLQFPNGKEVPVLLVAMNPPKPSYSRYGPFLDGHYSRLKLLADAGDANAAKELHDVLDDCEHYVKPGVALSKALSKNRTERIGKGEDYVQAGEEQLRRYYVACEGVGLNMLAEKNEWLTKAADGGNPVAMQDLFLQKYELRDPSAQLILEKMWEEGHTSSLLTYAVTSNRDKDAVLSYAYYLAYFVVAQATWDATQNPERFQGQANVVGNDLASKGSMLSSSEFQRAEELAIDIVSSNKKCCKGYYNVSSGGPG